MLSRLGSIGKEISESMCYWRGGVSILIGILISIVGLYLRVRKYAERESISVKILSTKSSHQTIPHKIKDLQFPREAVVTATREPGTSTETCKTVTKSTRRRGSDSTRTCKCDGYTYKYNEKLVNCPGHTGPCNYDRNHIVETTNEDGSSTLSCRPNNDTVQCAFTFAAPYTTENDGENEDFNLTCTRKKTCEQNVDMYLPVSEATKKASCPKDNWNACTMDFRFEGRDRGMTINMNAGCEDKVDTMQKIYYDRKNDTFSEKFTSVKDLMHTIAYVLLGIGLFMSASGGGYLYVVTKWKWFCHGHNALEMTRGTANMISNALDPEVTDVHVSSTML